MRRLLLDDGTAWPDDTPNDPDEDTLAWRVCHHDLMTRSELNDVASVMEAYQWLVHGDTTEGAVAKLRMLRRTARRNGAKR